MESKSVFLTESLKKTARQHLKKIELSVVMVIILILFFVAANTYLKAHTLITIAAKITASSNIRVALASSYIRHGEFPTLDQLVKQIKWETKTKNNEGILVSVGKKKIIVPTFIDPHCKTSTKNLKNDAAIVRCIGDASLYSS
jgi:hypothetical protein